MRRCASLNVLSMQDCSVYTSPSLTILYVTHSEGILHKLEKICGRYREVGDSTHGKGLQFHLHLFSLTGLGGAKETEAKHPLVARQDRVVHAVEPRELEQ